MSNDIVYERNMMRQWHRCNLNGVCSYTENGTVPIFPLLGFHMCFVLRIYYCKVKLTPSVCTYKIELCIISL